MKRSRLFLAIAAAFTAVVLLAQTKLSTDQLPSPGTGRVWVNYNDELRHARIENAELVEVNGDLVFRPIPVALAMRREQRVATADAEVFQLANSPAGISLAVSVNGLEQWEGDDYTVQGQTVTMPYVTAGSRVIFRYVVVTTSGLSLQLGGT